MNNNTSSQNGNPPSKEGGKSHLSIKNLAEDDRPREKMRALGPGSMTNSELLAILISTGTTKKTAIEVCQELLQSADNSLRRLYDMDLGQIMKIDGLGPAKALTIKAALEIGHRVPREDNPRLILDSSGAIYEYIRPNLEYLDAEEIWLIFLRNNLSVIGKEQLSKGGQTQTQFDIKIAMRRILEMKASAVVMVHNHPSGSLVPSQQDKHITTKLKQACKIMDISCLDHLIIGENKYYSFADHGIIDQL